VLIHPHAGVTTSRVPDGPAASTVAPPWAGPPSAPVHPQQPGGYPPDSTNGLSLKHSSLTPNNAPLCAPMWLAQKFTAATWNIGMLAR
jgi:hypothetical protein